MHLFNNYYSKKNHTISYCDYTSLINHHCLKDLEVMRNFTLNLNNLNAITKENDRQFNYCNYYQVNSNSYSLKQDNKNNCIYQ